MEGPIKEKGEVVDLARRGVVVGGTAAVLGTMYSVYPKSLVGVEEVVPSESNQSTVNQHEQPPIFEDYSDSSIFNHYCDLERPALERDAAIAVERVDLVNLLREHFTLPRIYNETLRNCLEELIIGVAFAESRFNTDATSEEQAFGFLQLMPKTINEHRKSGEDLADPVTHIKIAARLLEQKYMHIKTNNNNDLELIKQNHFAGDDEAFSSCFLAPLFINCYNAGEGTLSGIVAKYAECFPTPESLKMVFEQDAYLTGFDVFIGMSHTAYNETWREKYREDATYYTTRVYAAYEVVKEAYQKAAQKA